MQDIPQSRLSQTQPSPLTSRARVLATLNHQTADRVPLFAPNIMRTHAPYAPELLAFLEDFPFDRLENLGGTVHPPSEQEELPDGTLRDGYGCRFKYMGVGLPYCIHSPLATAASVAEVDAYAWPDPTAPGLIAPDAVAHATRLRAPHEHVTTVSVPPLFHQYHYIRGFEEWMVDIKLHRGIHQAIAEHIHHINRTLVMRLLDRIGDMVDIVTTGDDFGTSTIPYMSPADFRVLVKPFYQDLIASIKGKFPHIKFYLHSHGQIMDLVPDFVECGVDVLNPILPLDNMDPVRLKADYGDALCFHGGIDIEHIVPFGSVAEVRDHVKRVLDILAPGGGYWLKLQAISPVIPPENVIAAYECALDYGVYDRLRAEN